MSPLRVSFLVGMLPLLSYGITSVTPDKGIDLVHVITPQKLNMTDMLLRRDPKDVFAWDDVVKVLERLKQAPSCGVEAASRLFTLCSELKDEPEDDHIKLDAVKTLYAIRMSVCETAEGGAEVPSSCNHAVSTLHTVIDRKKVLQHDLNIIQSGSTPSCIHSLQKEHFYWTSYSNHRQDAGKVCDAMSAGVEHQKIIMFYREVIDSLAGIVQVVDKHRTFSDEWFEQSGTQVQDMLDNYRSLTSSLAQQREEQAAKSLEGMKAIGDAAAEANKAMSHVKDNLADTIAELHSSMIHIKGHLPKLQADIGRLFAGASQDVIEVVNTQKQELSSMMAAVVELYDATATDALSRSFQALAENIQDAHSIATSTLELQKEQIPLLEDAQSVLSRHVKLQRESQQLTDDVMAELRNISSFMTVFAGPVKFTVDLLSAYEASDIGLPDVAMFGLVTTGSTILFLTPGFRLWGIYAYEVYLFLIFLRAYIHCIDVQARSAEFFRCIEAIRHVSLENTILSALLVGVIIAGYIGARVACKLGAERTEKELADEEALTQDKVFTPHTGSHRSARASTAPPMFCAG